MTEFRDSPSAVDRWRATIEALEAVVLAEYDEPEPDRDTDAAAAEEIRRLIMVLLASRRRSPLPAAWVRRPGIVMPPVADPEPAPELKEQKFDEPPLSGPVWRE
jgi:hypothetical protein